MTESESQGLESEHALEVWKGLLVGIEERFCRIMLLQQTVSLDVCS